MGLTNLTEMMRATMDRLSESVDTGTIIGKSITVSDEMTIIPVTKLTVGFVTGGAEIDGMSEKLNDTNTPVGAIGGGMTITPVGFLVVSKNGTATILRADGNNGVEKWLDIVGNTIKDFMQKE